MTTIRNFFSPTKTSLLTSPSPVKSEITSISVSRPDNKLIVSNMKSVINSVKLQKKAKKRKRNLDEPQEIHDISNILQSNLSFISPNRTELELNKNEIAKESRTVGKPVDVKPVEIPTIASSQKEYVDSIKENNSDNTTTSCSQPTRDETKPQSTANAFEFMMTARYKSIGTNSPGRELSNEEVTTAAANRETKVKRILLLEEWAERKGRAKKRIQEAADDEYIDTTMKKRAKRLRTLLTNGKKQKEIEISDEETVSSTPPNEVKLTKRNNRIEDSEDDDCNEVGKFSRTNRSNRKKNNARKNSTDENFSENLSSPLKKRDSLLGYFSKMTKTPPDAIPQTFSDVSENVSRAKKRGRSKKTLPIEKTLDTSSKTRNNQRKVTPSPPPTSDSSKASTEGRPKRLCREKKISYFIDEDYTSLKMREKKTVDKDYGTPKAVVKQSKPTKLAPIFAKVVPKPMIDTVALRARHEFLMSGIPEKMKLEIEKQRQFEESYETAFEVFPKISHIGQHTESTNIVMDLAAMNIRFRHDTLDDEGLKYSFDRSKLMKILKFESNNQEHGIDASMDQKELIKTLKQNDTLEFPYFRCFKQLKRKNMPNLSLDEDGDCSIELIVEKVSSANGNELFTEKYRPMTSSEVLINSKPLIELKKFLSTWQENMDGRECMDSSDDFDTNSSSGMSSLNKAIVLTGPAGCGKTMFVYALANEMNFKVLEINAGAKRTGKKVLQKLQEATQSHHVNNNQCSQNDRSKLTKAKSNQADDSEDSGGTQKLSLILIEDAEIVFEQDFGFIDSINQLITTTKRPVILITNQINCPHLSRFINRNMITFKSPKPLVASKWFSTLSVAEHCYVTEDMCRTLYQRNNFDFRKTFLELQFFIQSTISTHDNNDKTAVCTNNKLRDLFFNDQNNLDLILPFPIDFTNLSDKGNQITNVKNSDENNDGKSAKVNSASLQESLEFLKIISAAQWLDQKTDCSDRVINHLSDDISHFMVEQSVKIRCLNQHSYWTESANESDIVSRPHQLASSISNRSHHSTKGFDLDIEPCLRSICRSELLRSHKERRSSRFYHYLRSANTDSFGTKVLDEHCSIFGIE